LNKSLIVGFGGKSEMVSFGFSPNKLCRAFALPFQMHVGNKLSLLGSELFE